MNAMRFLLIVPLLIPATAGANHLITNDTVSLNSQQVIQVHDPNTGSRRTVTVDQGSESRGNGSQTPTVNGYSEEEVKRFISVFGHPPPAR